MNKLCRPFTFVLRTDREEIEKYAKGQIVFSSFLNLANIRGGRDWIIVLEQLHQQDRNSHVLSADQIIALILIFTGWLLSVIKSAQLYFYGSRLVKCFTTQLNSHF